MFVWIGKAGGVGQVGAELLQGGILRRLVEFRAQFRDGHCSTSAGGFGQHLAQLRIGQHKRLDRFHGDGFHWLDLRLGITADGLRMTSSRLSIDDSAAVLALSAKAEQGTKPFRNRSKGIDKAEIVDGRRREIAFVVDVVGKRFV